MGGSSLLLLWHPLEIVIICGAALGAFLISNPMKVVKDSFTGALGLVKGVALRPPRIHPAAQAHLRHSRHGPQRWRAGHRAAHRGPREERYLQEVPGGDGRSPHDGIHHGLPAADLRRQPGSARTGEPARIRAGDPPSRGRWSLRTRCRRWPTRCRASASWRRCWASSPRWRASTARAPRRSATTSARRWWEPSWASWWPTASSGPIAAAMEAKANEEAKAFEVVKMALVASVRGYPPPVAMEFARKLLFSYRAPELQGPGAGTARQEGPR